MNEDFWAKLTNDQQTIISEALDETTRWNQTQSFKMNDEQLSLIKDNSSIDIHYLTNEEKREWAKRWQPLYREFEEEIGKELLSKMIKLRNTNKDF